MDDPELRKRLEEVYQLRAQADELEEQLVRAALEKCHWLEATAARLLGMPRPTLQRLLRSGRLKHLGKEAAKQRKDAGYQHGRKLSDVM
jgi:transcriptional regulator with GAF, ATPase, and Fis domain